jgi:transposase
MEQGLQKKNRRQLTNREEIGIPKYIWLPPVIGVQWHFRCLLVTAMMTPKVENLSPNIDSFLGKCAVIMDKAYESDETRKLICKLGFIPVVQPKQNRVVPWKYSKKMYKKRNEVERLFRRLKGFRRVATRYDKLNIMFMSFVVFAFVVIGLRKTGG